MPKRDCPFGDQSSLQLKTHIGTKEINKGVDQTIRMQSVYDKTHEMLFSGMKGYMSQPEMNNNNFGVNHELGDASQKKDNFKQMHLDNKCQLVSDDVEMDQAESVHLSSDQGLCGMNCPSTNECHSDFHYGRTPIEYSPPGFVSAASLVAPAQHSSGLVSGGNVFEKMKMAQLNMTPRLQSVGGACLSCTKPVLSRDVMKCQFCENYVCSTCTRQCNGCFLHFCQLCSILNYSQVKERAFCFSCNER